MLHYIKNKTNTAAKKLIYNAFIKPHINYNAAIYGSCNQINITNLQKTQNKAINILFNNYKHKHKINLYKTNHILTVKNIIYIEKMKHIYKYTKYPETIPKDTRTLYDELNEKRNERPRYKLNMNIQRYNKEIGKKHSYNNTTEYNKLDTKTKSSPTIHTFIKTIKTDKQYNK